MKTKGPYDTLKRSPKEFASDIMDTIQKYGRHIHVSHTLGQCEWIGRSIFLDTVEEQVSQDKAIKMILPAFPWKSVSHISLVKGLAKRNRSIKLIKFSVAYQILAKY